MMIMKSVRSFKNCQSGAAAAEMVLIMPLLLVLVFGALEIGQYFWHEHRVVKAVRDGARFAARQPFTKFSCAHSSIIVGGGNTSTDTALETQIKNVTRTGDIAGSGKTIIPGWTNSDITVSVSCPATAVTTGIYTGQANAPRIKVAADIPYAALASTMGFNTTGLRVRSEAEAAVTGI